jgi:hypothetical protein
MSAPIDAMAEMLLREHAQREMIQLMDDVHPKDFTACELIAMVAICRGVKERLDAQQRTPAPVLKLLRGRQSD